MESRKRRISKMKCQGSTRKSGKLPPFKAHSCIGKIKQGKDGKYTPYETKNGVWTWKKI
jgi:hypothetical protein